MALGADDLVDGAFGHAVDSAVVQTAQTNLLALGMRG